VKAYEGHWARVPDLPNICGYIKAAQGDLQAGFREADQLFEHTFRVPRGHQGYLEPHACMVRADPSGGAEIWTSNKNPYLLRGQLAKALNVAEEKLVVHPVWIWGDFGGKGHPMDVSIAYLLSLQAGRPVKMVMSYVEELLAGNPRHPGVITLRTGVKRDGRLCAMDVRAVWDAGAYGAFVPVPFINVAGTREAANCYRVGAMNLEAFAAYTNNVPSGHVRAPGAPSVVFAAESHLDIIAKELGLDPVEFRRRNVLRPGDAAALGEQWEEIRAQETLENAAQAAGWGKPKPGPHFGRGVAMYHRSGGFGDSSSQLTLDETGRLSVHIPTGDSGQGVATVVLQVVAEVLQVAPERVRVILADTNTLPFDGGVGHSRSTNTIGGAAWQAAQELRKILLSAAAEALETPDDHLTLENGRFIAVGDPSRSISFDEAAARALRARGGPVEVKVRQQSEHGHETSFCTQIAEVEVDPETGQVKVHRMVTSHETGTVINPVGFQGQIEGGVVYGLGSALMEDLVVEEGKPLTLSLGDYKLPNIQDIPELQSIVLQEPHGPAPFKGRGIGEISNVPTAAAVANAIADAVGVRLFELPLSAEKVYGALKKAQGAEHQK
jgi:CO/xanthine dehydrogenase Mo-binding subunit